MIKIISIAALFTLLFHYSDVLAGNSISISGRDTTISASLENNKGKETINATLNDSTQDFTLKIGSASTDGKFNDAFDIDLKVVDIDKDDNYKELVLIGQGPDDDNDCYFYEYANGSIIPCGHIENISSFKTDGNKQLQADSWMGFWTKTEDYSFDAKYLVKKPKETYSISEVNGTVKNKISLLKNRSDDSPSAGSLKPGTKFTITKGDISPKCSDNDGSDNSYQCYWYYIISNDGTEGWCRLKNFENNVEGLPWAG